MQNLSETTSPISLAPFLFLSSPPTHPLFIHFTLPIPSPPLPSPFLFRPSHIPLLWFLPHSHFVQPCDSCVFVPLFLIWYILFLLSLIRAYLLSVSGIFNTYLFYRYRWSSQCLLPPFSKHDNPITMCLFLSSSSPLPFLILFITFLLIASSVPLSSLRDDRWEEALCQEQEPVY